MSFLDQFKSLFTSTTPADPNALWLYVKCKRCSTLLAVRVDLRNELSADYENGGFLLTKEMMDNKCFTLMRAQVRFDARRNIVEQKLDQGDFLTQAEYDQLKTKA
jgi:hypothetical protein